MDGPNSCEASRPGGRPCASILNSRAATMGWANVLYGVGNADLARLSMQRAIELDHNYSGAMNDLSLLELNAGRLDQSAYWAMRAWPLAPNVPNAYYHVSIALGFFDDDIARRWVAAAAARFKPDDPAGGQRIPLIQAHVGVASR